LSKRRIIRPAAPRLAAPQKEYVNITAPADKNIVRPLVEPADTSTPITIDVDNKFASLVEGVVPIRILQNISYEPIIPPSYLLLAQNGDFLMTQDDFNLEYQY
jgi:hypothetical protein